MHSNPLTVSNGLTLAPETPEREAFLALVPNEQRSTATNRFLSQARAGLRDPQEIVEAVLIDTRTRFERHHVRLPEAAAKHSALIAIIKAHPLEALGFAVWAIKYAALPEEERQALKAARGAEAVSLWMASHAPTQKQREFLAGLGHRGAMPETAEQASDLIDSLRNGGRR